MKLTNNREMKWIKLKIGNLPGGEVLAANFKACTYGYQEKLIGCLSINGDSIICENEHELLEGCTHYIDLNKYDIN